MAPFLEFVKNSAGASFLVLENSSFRVRHNFQNRILSRHELPAPGCTRRLGKAETASL
jgi:hypothetical protein